VEVEVRVEVLLQAVRVEVVAGLPTLLIWEVKFRLLPFRLLLVSVGLAVTLQTEMLALLRLLVFLVMPILLLQAVASVVLITQTTSR
jgi:hypothetical protein